MISLIYPSRGRAVKAADTADKWIKSAGVDVELILSIDSSDDTEKYINEFSRKWLLNPYGNTWRSEVVINDNKSVVEATNKAAKVATGDILIYLSDDFDAPENWGPLVLKEFEGVEGPCLVKVDDMLQPFHVPVITIPIMNRALYERLGYFWMPEYKSMFVDQDLYEVVKKNGWLKLAPHLKFEHKHVSVGKAQDDETYRNSAKNWDQGKALFARRKAAGFPI
jgi:glycosyltransferase involved in cell wall biosynthesis